MGANMAFGALQGRANRRFTERQSALDKINAYKQYLAQMMAQDPARFIQMALAGLKSKTARQNIKSSTTGKSVFKSLSKDQKELYNILADPETYNLKRREGGGFDLNLPQFNPAVSEKYAPHLGGFTSGGQTQQFGAATAPTSYGVPPAVPQAPVPFQVPRPGFTSKWG
jgi:hypothetical protein